MSKKMKRSFITVVIAVILIVGFLLFFKNNNSNTPSVQLGDIPTFSGESFVVLNNNEPTFTEKELITKAYEYYSPLDRFGRCGYAMACIGKELMPTEERESIGNVKPSGWVQAQYDVVDGNNLYNRCHLIGFQLTGENANEKNLITGTRYMNVEGMLPFENMVADYIKETGNHVVFRVTPIYEGDNLIASGVQMEAKSVEDRGEGICYNVYVYNSQPGVVIDYATGESWLENETRPTTVETESTYILNKSSKKFHTETCEQGRKIKGENKELYNGSKESLIQNGYTASKCCNP